MNDAVKMSKSFDVDSVVMMEPEDREAKLSEVKDSWFRELQSRGYGLSDMFTIYVDQAFDSDTTTVTIEVWAVKLEGESSWRNETLTKGEMYDAIIKAGHKVERGVKAVDSLPVWGGILPLKQLFTVAAKVALDLAEETAKNLSGEE